MKTNLVTRTVALTLAAVQPLTGLPVLASSHREAPLLTTMPKVDCTDFYLFTSYETGRSDYVTIIANYLPLQDAYGGPNYFTLDPNALYEIHIDNNGDAVEDLTFQFRFNNTYRNVALPIGPAGNQKVNAIPLIIAGQIKPGDNAALNLDESYSVKLIRGPRRASPGDPVTNAKDGSSTFTKPVDYIGEKTLPDYEAYANQYIYEINLPGCDQKGRLFVGQRKDPFVVNLGETFDLINISTSPLGPPDANRDSLFYKNVTSLVLELPKSCITSPGQPIIGAWSTASLVSGNTVTQVSRLSMPLVNEVVIGIKDKDKFNASEPKDDLQFVDYVTHPTLPALIELLFSAAGAKAPDVPRNDLVAAFATGIEGLNKNGSVAEMQRLNTTVPAVPRDQQKHLGALAGDSAGFPNGRRPGDDVVDIALRVVMGALVPGAPNQNVPFTDGAYLDATMLPDKFPYLNPPLKGSPNDPYISVLLQSAAQVQGPFRNATGVKWDQAAKKFTADKPDAATGFFRAEADGKVTLDGVKVNPANVEIGAK
jgi:hypothetical protein